MDTLIQILLVLHFVGLAMGLSVSFANIVMSGLIAKSAPAERGVLARFPPLMSRLGNYGLGLLWLSGLGLVQFKWGGFGNIGSMPWQFHAKLTLVIILSALVGFLQAQLRRLAPGDTAGMARLQMFGKLAFVTALAIVVFAVLAFG